MGSGKDGSHAAEAPKPVVDQSKGFIAAVMAQKEIDHHASHSNLINQWLHLLSSSMFIYCYAVFFNEHEKAMYIGLTSLVLRQAGHYIFEPPCHDKEQAMLGFDTDNKVKIVITYGVIPALIMMQVVMTTDVQISLAEAWLVVTFAVVFGRVALLWYRYGFMVSMHWFVKFITDPFTDLPAYWQSGYQVFNPKLVQGALASSFPRHFAEPEGYVKPTTHFDEVLKKHH